MSTNRKKYINSNHREWLLIILLFGFLSVLISLIISWIESDVEFSSNAYFNSCVILFFCLGVIGNTLYTNWHGITSLGKFYGILIGSVLPITVAIITAFVFKELKFKTPLSSSHQYEFVQISIFIITIICISVVKRNALAKEYDESEENLKIEKNIEEQKQTLISFKSDLKIYILKDHNEEDLKKFKNDLFDLRDKLDDVISKM